VICRTPCRRLNHLPHIDGVYEHFTVPLFELMPAGIKSTL
jgi:hypothetical protein